MLKLLGVAEQRLDRIVTDYRQADLSPATSALLTLVFKLGTKEAVQEASAHGLSDESILEAILIAGLSRLLCTLSTGVGAVPDFAPRSIPSAQIPLADTDHSAEFFRSTPKLPDDFEPMLFLRKEFGSVPKVFSAQTLRPDILQAEADALRYLLLSEDALSRAQKRDILLAGTDLETLRERGFTENQVLEAVVTTSFAGFFNVLQTGLGAGSDFAAKMPAKKAHLSASGTASHRCNHIRRPGCRVCSPGARRRSECLRRAYEPPQSARLPDAGWNSGEPGRSA